MIATIKRLVGIFLMLMIISAQCNAMSMSWKKPDYDNNQGRIDMGNICGFHVKNAFYNDGKCFTYKHKRGYVCGENYESGLAKFGDRTAPLCIDYDYKPFFLVHDENNSKSYSVPWLGEGYSLVSNIENDNGLKMYFLETHGLQGYFDNYYLFAYQKDGKFVKYIDTGEAREKYFGNRKSRDKALYRVEIAGNKVIFSYGASSFNMVKGALVYTWDEKAQWFSVENVTY